MVVGTPRIRAGEQLVFLKVVAVAPAVVRRDGKVQAGGHPADHARLGALEQQLDELAGPGVIDEIAAQATLGGKVKGKARRSMTAAAVIRATVLMALMPDADYAGVLAALFGDLALVPWQRAFQVPTPKVLGTWRAALGPVPLLRLQARLLAAVGGQHRDRDYRAVRVGELRLGSIDGSVTRVPDTPANRKAFGSAGTADDSGPYPQVRDLLAGDASTRATLAVVSGPSGGPKAEGEQTLLDTMITRCPEVFTSGRVWVLDRNFPGADRVARILATGTHVLIRVKSDIALPRIGGFLPDGSYCSYLTGGGGRWCLKVRVIEYHVTVAGQDVPEMFCLITDLHDHAAYPAAQLAGAYAWRSDRVRDRAEGSQVRHRRRRAVRRADPPLENPGADRSGARRLDLRHRAGPRPGPRRRRARPPPPARAAAGSRAAPAHLLHRRPPRRPGQHPVRCRHRQPARRHHRGPCTAAPCTTSATAASSPAGTGTATARQSPPGIPRRRTRRHHPHRGRPGQRLRAELRPDRRPP